MEKGQELQDKMFGKEYATKVSEVRQRFPKFQEWTLGTLYGEVWTRDNELDLKTRSLCNVAALVVLNLPDQLYLHVKGAIQNGATADEICEVIMQMAFYGGWPCTITAQKVAVQVFNELGI